MTLRVLQTLLITAVLILVPGFCLLEHWLIADINRSGHRSPVRHWQRITWKQYRELEHTHRELFPGSWKLDAFLIVRRLSMVLGVVMVSVLWSMLSNRTAQH